MRSFFNRFFTFVAMGNEVLSFEEFEVPSKEQWLSQAVKELKGKPINDLNKSWYGIDIQPFFSNVDLPVVLPSSRSVTSRWELVLDSIKDAPKTLYDDVDGLLRIILLAVFSGTISAEVILRRNHYCQAVFSI